MSLLKKLFILILLTGLYVPAHAAVDGVSISACTVFSEAGEDDKSDGKGAEEEEPDCE